MMYAYDLHIHSALSPCADDDMTPGNITAMAALKGLDIIAIADHNSCGNVRAVIEAAKNYSITVLPAMEVETAEEVHVVCYFPDIASAEKMHGVLKAGMMKIKNNPLTFGNQFYMDADDNIIGIEENLLVSATSLSFQEVFLKAKESGGFAVPAHIDRQSYSVISNLGFIPPDTDVQFVEITAKNLDVWKGKYTKYGILTNSDAHNLGNIAERERFLEISDKNIDSIMKYFIKNFL